MTVKNSDRFLSSFNRINKWLLEKSDNPINIPFVSLVGHMKKRRDLRLAPFANDLIQFAQLRNAIVHDQTNEAFVIAEPNDWAVERIEAIEHELLHPERVLPRFRKKITLINAEIPISELLEIVAKKKFTLYPVVKNQEFQGLLTLKMIGFWVAERISAGESDFSHYQVADLLARPEKRAKFSFVPSNFPTDFCIERFQNEPNLEAILITKHGERNEEILGIIRPNDLFKKAKNSSKTSV
ncbi:hypothetical protein SAMN02745116_00137 [Pilibacter termitis]|uniref:CBS domain-containing protein n=1 Tax=Pilibacter termitis TaxID=263852 RepID=A0A1T4K7P7_9ENTE|nr:CBS domain-containing protein [Pilibacter termitis]SJZ38439.1 hypothetical protein SAMN02745116_00137 [Pilibacter termitis]